MSLTLILLVAVALADSPAVAPATPVRPVVDILHGQPIEYRYRWLEQRDDPVVVVGACAKRLHLIRPGAIAEDVTADTVAPSSPEIAIEVGRYRRLPDGKAIFLARTANDPVDAVYLRETDGTVTRAFVPALAPDGKGADNRLFEPAPDSRHVALAIGENGSENNAPYVPDLQTGQLVDGPIPVFASRRSAGGRTVAAFRLSTAQDMMYCTDGARDDAGLYAGQQVYAHAGHGLAHRPGGLRACDAVECGHARRRLPGRATACGGGARVCPAFCWRGAGIRSVCRATRKPGSTAVSWRRLFTADAGYGMSRTVGSTPVVVANGRVFLIHLAGKGRPTASRLCSRNSRRLNLPARTPPYSVWRLPPTVSTCRCKRACVSDRFTLPQVRARHHVPLPFDGQFDLVQGDARIAGVLLRDRRWTERSRYWVVRGDAVSELTIPKGATGRHRAHRGGGRRAERGRHACPALHRPSAWMASRPTHAIPADGLCCLRHQYAAGVQRQSAGAFTRRDRLRRLPCARWRRVRRSMASRRHARQQASGLGRLHRMRAVAHRPRLHPRRSPACRRRQRRWPAGGAGDDRSTGFVRGRPFGVWPAQSDAGGEFCQLERSTSPESRAFRSDQAR